MSRSYRKYSGLNHTQSDTKQGKALKRQRLRETRRKLKLDAEGYAPLGRKCHKNNFYDKCVINGAEEEWLQYRSEGYKIERLSHKLRGK